MESVTYTLHGDSCDCVSGVLRINNVGGQNGGYSIDNQAQSACRAMEKTLISCVVVYCGDENMVWKGIMNTCP